MADQPAQQAPDVVLAQAINGPVGFLQQQQQQQPPPAPVQQPAAPLLHLFNSDQLFDLSTHASSSAFHQACKALDIKWNGSVNTFPAFVTSLRLKAREVGWNRAGATNIMLVNGRHILDNYHCLTQAKIDVMAVTRTNPALSKMLEPCTKHARSPSKVTSSLWSSSRTATSPDMKTESVLTPIPNVPNRFDVSEGADMQTSERDPHLFRIQQKHNDWRLFKPD